MFNFINLVANENMKIYRRVRLWIMWGILVALIVGISLVASASSSSPISMWSMVNIDNTVVLSLVTIFSVIIAADMVAGEFSAGTIKLLLIRPWSRGKILLSKYVALLLFSLFSLVIVYVVSIVTNLLVFGYEKGVKAAGVFGVANPDLSAWSYLNQYYVLAFVTLIVTVTLAFMISAVFRSSGLAIGLSLFIVLAGPALGQLLKLVNRKWVDYILFEHLGLSRYIGSTVRQLVRVMRL